MLESMDESSTGRTVFVGTQYFFGKWLESSLTQYFFFFLRKLFHRKENFWAELPLSAVRQFSNQGVIVNRDKIDDNTRQRNSTSWLLQINQMNHTENSPPLYILYFLWNIVTKIVYSSFKNLFSANNHFSSFFNQLHYSSILQQNLFLTNRPIAFVILNINLKKVCSFWIILKRNIPFCRYNGYLKSTQIQILDHIMNFRFVTWR